MVLYEKQPKIEESIQKAYPGALPNAKLAEKIQECLTSQGFESSKTQLATSLCSDEVNRALDDVLRSIYGYNFSMGGLAGFPFAGVTGFCAMAHHIPEGGSCLVVYGPHVGIDKDGVVGKVNRKGRPHASGACCGSATAAAAYVRKVTTGECEPAPGPSDLVDAQQIWVGAQLLPFGKRIQDSSDSNVEVPLALFDCQDSMMKKIVKNACGEVAGDGKIALLGGIQINTPIEDSDFFLVKTFEIRNNKGKILKKFNL